MASSNGRETKMTASIDSLKLSSKSTSKHASCESMLSKKDKECLQMQECKKKLLANEPHIIIRDENVVLRSPPQKKIVMPPNINPEELAASTPTQRNWRGILIALLVIAAVLALIVFSIVLLTPAGGAGGARGRRPVLQQLLSKSFEVPKFNGTWLSDTELVYRDRWGGLTLLNARNLTTRLICTNSTFRELNAVDFKISPDLKFVLLISDVRPGWRHARLARYHVYDVFNRNKIPISPLEEDRSAPLLQYAEWSPVGSSLVFVHDNDIYYKPRVLKTLVCRITKTGVPGVIFNGVPDFLYESQVLRLEKALWFSPDGQNLLYVTYNDSAVPEYKYPWYGFDEPEPPAYPTIRTLRYPKMGSPNPVASLYVVSLKTPKFLFPHEIQFNSPVDKDWYIRWSGWSSERTVSVLLLNRPQNVSVVAACSALQYNCQDLYTSTSGGSRWSGLGAEAGADGWERGVALAGTKDAVYTTAPVTDQDVGTWRHAVKIADNMQTPLTQGPFEVSSVLGFDEKRKLLYVLGTAPEAAGSRHLYRVPVSAPPPSPAAAAAAPAVTCLTCPDADIEVSTVIDIEPTLEEEYENATWTPLTDSSTTAATTADNETVPIDCRYNRIYFSSNFSYYVQECLGPSPPTTYLCSRTGVRILTLWDGQPLRSRAAALAAPAATVFKVEVQGARAARVRLFLPPGFRETDDLPLPLVLQISGEPGAQLVTDRWQLDWAWYLAASRNFIVAQVDASGSGGQGEELRTEIYQKLMTLDVEDQIAVLSYLRENLRMVDGARVGAWGAGAGGGAALALAAADPANITRCVAAAAPLTDLTHTTSYYSERYYGFGGLRSGGAAAAAAWRRAGGAAARRLLLAHATADLHAHPVHALRVARALEARQAVFRHQIYPDEGHNFERSTLHLYTTMEQFFDECFGPVELADWDVGMEGLFPFRQ